MSVEGARGNMTPKEAKALKPLSVAALQCPVCKRLYLAPDKAATCTKKCGWKAYLSDLANRKETTRKANMDWVRLNATSPSHAIKLLIQYTKTLGITLSFTAYPSYFYDISNSHNAPIGFVTNWWGKDKEKGKDLPSSYPGFSGNWVGTIRGQCPYRGCWKKNEPDLNCLFEHIVNGFSSGTGCPAQNFHIGGQFYLYDFPKMMTKGGLISTLLELRPGIPNLKAIEIACELSPKLIISAAKVKNPDRFEISHYLPDGY
jgi:hypothetical protein